MSDLLRELQGTSCRCGRPKKEHMTFCRSCYFALSPELRKSLYRRMGVGYEEAYAEALQYLVLQGEMDMVMAMKRSEPG